MQRPKQPIKRTTPLKKIIAAALSALLLFSLAGCEQKDWIKDGEYWPYPTQEKTFEKLFDLAEAGDIDGIYQVFSRTAQNENADLREKVGAFVQFAQEEMTSYEVDGSSRYHKDADHGMIVERREMYATLYTDSTTYRCRIIDVPQDSYVPDNAGFYSLILFPDSLREDYNNLGVHETGCYIVYQGGAFAEQPMDTVLGLASAGDTDGLCQLFAQPAQENADDLWEQTDKMAAFLQQKITSWDFDTWTTEQRTLFDMDVTMRHWLGTIHTDDQDFRCSIRDMLSDTGESIGIYSISIYPQELYMSYRMDGRDEPGAFLKILTIKPMEDDLERLSRGETHTVRIVTSVEAEVTGAPALPSNNEKERVVLTQVDALTWKASFSELDYRMPYTITATTETESVSCNVTVPEVESDD